VEALRRAHAERAVLRMFTWRVGEFSFEVRESVDLTGEPLALASGINAQYLTMEASRLSDEGGRAPAAPPVPPAPHEVLALAGAARAEPDPEPELEPRPEPEPEPEPRPEPEPEPEPELAPRAEAEPEVEPATPAPPQAAAAVPAAAPGRAAPAAPSAPPPLVAIDPELSALEWLKSHLDGLFARVHIFQHSEGGIARVRQYLARGELPVVVLSTRAPADSLSGAADANELLRRLRAQAPRMAIIALHESGRDLPPGVDAADALVTRPSGVVLRDARRREAQASGAELAAALRPWAHPAAEGLPLSPPLAAPSRRRPQATEAALRALARVSERLRDRSTRGEVLNLVLDFAAQRFRREALFMVRDDEAVGLAQHGLSAAGGPDDEAFRALHFPLPGCAWFRRALQSGESSRAAPSDEGDRRLAAQLGSRAPREAFVAPIESGGRPAALLYADNLPGASPIGDTTVLAIVLHEAGLALDRAVLERALAEAGS
jgi:hypothetical protein